MMKLFLVLFVLLNLSNYGFSCTCIGEESVKVGLKNSDVVFHGTVISVKEVLIENKYDKTVEFKVLLKVTKKYKGRKIQDTLEIITPDSDGMCGISFQVGFNYIIYSKKESLNSEKQTSKRLTTNRCSRTRLYSKKEEDEILNHVN